MVVVVVVVVVVVIVVVRGLRTLFYLLSEFSESSGKRARGILLWFRFTSPFAGNLFILYYRCLTSSRLHAGNCLLSGIHIIAVGYGPRDLRPELERIASAPAARNVFIVRSFADVLRPLYNLAAALCPRK